MKDQPYDPKKHKPRRSIRGTETRITGDPKKSQAYNCHSFAWHDSLGDPTDPGNAHPYIPPRWDNSPVDDMKEATRLPDDAPNKPGDIVVYGTDKNFNGELEEGEIDHSAVVIDVDPEGNTTYVKGKEGQGPITTHHPRQQNPYYGSRREYYRK